MKQCASIFSGCGGSDAGMKEAGFDPVFGVEYDPSIAEIFKLNHSADLCVGDLLEVDSIPEVDLLWVSPPCPSFSQANSQKGETANDLLLANKIARLIEGSYPRHIAIENVPAYAESESLRILEDRLTRLGYYLDRHILNSADFGVPQRRVRLIVRASTHPLFDRPILKTHVNDNRQIELFDTQKEKQVSWFKAIAHLLPSLKKQEMTKKQLTALNPFRIVTRWRLIERVGYRGELPRSWGTWELAPTIRSHTCHDGKGSYRVALNVTHGDECWEIDIKCLAAFQSFPSDYQWGDDRVAAGRAIGNAVPPLLAKAIANSFHST